MTWYKVVEWINVGVLVGLLLMSLSYILLPPEATRRHYLSVCLVITSIMITVGFNFVLSVSTIAYETIAGFYYTISRQSK